MYMICIACIYTVSGYTNKAIMHLSRYILSFLNRKKQNWMYFRPYMSSYYLRSKSSKLGAVKLNVMVDCDS